VCEKMASSPPASPPVEERERIFQTRLKREPVYRGKHLNQRLL